jgi:hypothetical protein
MEGLKCDCKARREQEKAERLAANEIEQLMEDTAMEVEEKEKVTELEEAGEEEYRLEEVDEEDLVEITGPEGEEPSACPFLFSFPATG